MQQLTNGLMKSQTVDKPGSAPATTGKPGSARTTAGKFTLWTPLSCLAETSQERIALIKLNTAFCAGADVNLFKTLWSKADIKACVDGGANAVYYHPALPHENFLPDLISGDFDSILPEVLQFYGEQNVEVMETPDQCETDFTKCLRLVHDKIKKSQTKISGIFVHVSQEGRIDHILANINTLYKSSEWSNLPVYLIYEQSLSCLLPKGRHCIEVDPLLRSDWCSLVPIGCPCDHVTITGLKYCTDDARLGFGELISTCNSFVDSVNQITVTTDKPILWSMGLALLKASPTSENSTLLGSTLYKKDD